MAKLSAFRIDTAAIQTGVWRKLGDEFGDIEVHVRGLGDEYNDARNARFRRAARGMGGDATKLSQAVQRGIVRDVLFDKVLLGVRGVEDDAGGAMDFETFKAKLSGPEYIEVLDAIVRVASSVGIERTEEIKDAAGNSPAPSPQA